jgi:hypothetical protein
MSLAHRIAAATMFAALSIVPAARASFHLWIVDQIYSDASGNVQYVQYTTTSPGQEFLTLSSLNSMRDTDSKTFIFPSDLPIVAGSTANKKFIVATQGFASLNTGVTPDYLMPNGFLFIPNGTITLVGADSVAYLALPTNGTHALNRNGTPVVAAPTNYAGNTGAVNVPPPIPAGPYDVDANGHVDALTDGLLLIRYMFQIRGDALTRGAVGPSAGRNTATAIQEHIASQIPPP